MLIESLKTLKVKTQNGDITMEPGSPVEFPQDQARKLLARAAGKVRLVGGGCYACGSSKVWLSIHDRLICGLCHPPADPTLVQEWLSRE